MKSCYQPFWPQGTGCARGFLGAMDSAWMIKKWKEMQGRPFDIIAERESIYKVEWPPLHFKQFKEEIQLLRFTDSGYLFRIFKLFL
jgi:hypothetical protein